MTEITNADRSKAVLRALKVAMAKVRITRGQADTIVARSRLPEIAGEQLATSAFEIARLNKELTMERRWRMRLQEQIWKLDPSQDPRR